MHKTIIITQNHQGERLDKCLTEKIDALSRSAIQNAITEGDILVNDQKVKAGYKLKAQDFIYINIKEESDISIEPQDIPFDIVFEDNYLMVIDKPAGLVVHPGAGNKSGTLVNALLFHCKDLSTLSGNNRPGIVHRLDKDTSGLLVVAKNNITHRQLQKQFETREIKRTYQALVWGVPAQKEGEIESNITRSKQDRKKMTVSRSQGKTAITTYKVLKDFHYLSFLELKLKTGRTHQIRVHLNHFNLPVFGDSVYNGRKSQIKRLPSHLHKRGLALLKKISRQALHAKELQFIHPVSAKKLCLTSELPKDFKNTLDSIEDLLLLR